MARGCGPAWAPIHRNVANPTAFERANYITILQGWSGDYQRRHASAATPERRGTAQTADAARPGGLCSPLREGDLASRITLMLGSHVVGRFYGGLRRFGIMLGNEVGMVLL